MIQRKILIAVVVLLAGFNSIVTAQSQQETEEWLKQIIENYPFNNNDITNEYRVTFYDLSNCYMEINLRTQIKSLSTDTFYRYRIWPKELTSVQIEERDHNVRLIFRVSPQAENKIGMDFPDYREQITEADILMAASLKHNNLTQRLVRAFNHYIEICGGSSIPDTF